MIVLVHSLLLSTTGKRLFRDARCHCTQHSLQQSGLFACAEQGTGRTGHAKTREAIYKWMDGFLRDMSPQKAAPAAAGAVEAIAVYGFRREADNYARAASLLPIQASLELKLPPWAMDRSMLQQFTSAHLERPCTSSVSSGWEY